MLTAEHRVTDGESFRRAVRDGARAGARTLVVHLATPASPDATGPAPRAGFVVSKAVGNAVVRNRVKRRLRHLSREHVATLPAGALLVVRALPASAEASSEQLGRDLERSIARCLASVPVPGRSA